MSKQYNNYAKNYQKQPVVTEPVVEPEVPDTEMSVEEAMLKPEAVEPVAEPEVEVAPPPAPVDGVVTAAKLNVRKQPNPNAQVVSVIKQNSKVQIDKSASTAEWYKVYTSAGVDGYCMKKFISVK